MTSLKEQKNPTKIADHIAGQLNISIFEKENEINEEIEESNTKLAHTVLHKINILVGYNFTKDNIDGDYRYIIESHFRSENGLEEIKKLIGFDSIGTDEIDNNRNMLYFDENCFIRDNKILGRFQIGSLAPVAGVGVVVRFLDSTEMSFEKPSLSLEDLQSLVKFL